MFSFLKKLFQGKKHEITSSPSIPSKPPEDPSPSWSTPSPHVAKPSQKEKDTQTELVTTVLAEQLSLEELRQLCFTLKIAFESLRGETKKGKVSSLVALFSKPPHTLNQFVESCSQLFPELDWSGKPVQTEPANVRFLLQGIKYCFNANEFRTLCLELGIDSENLPGSASGKIRELLNFLSRKRRLNELVAICSRLRPNIDWHSKGEFSGPYQLINLAAFQQLLYDNFDEETIRQFCQKFDVDYKRLPLWEQGGTARELVLYLARRSRLEEFVTLCDEHLPELSWSEVLFAQNVSPDVKAHGKSVDPLKMQQELTRLGENSLRTLCLLLGIHYDDLPGSNQRDELLSFMQRRGRMLDLADALENLPDDV